MIEQDDKSDFYTNCLKEERYLLRKIIIDELFQYEPLIDCGIDVNLLRQIVCKRNENDKYEIQASEDSFLSDHLYLENERNQDHHFLEVWNGNMFDKAVTWHEMVIDCSTNFGLSLSFRGVMKELFDSAPIMRSVHELLISVYNDLYKIVIDGIDTDALVSARAKIPFATNLLWLFEFIEKYLEQKSLEIEKLRTTKALRPLR